MYSVLTIRPQISRLYELIDKVHKYPLSNQQLIDLASKIKAPQEVIDFYRTFNDRIYQDREELLSISEQVDLMRQEEAEMPKEIERGPEDY